MNPVGGPTRTYSNKRARTRSSVACTQCRNRRSKCDLLDETGCHRCKQLRTDCSLQGRYSSSIAIQMRAASPSLSAAPEEANLSSVMRAVHRLEDEIRALRNTNQPVSSPHFDYGDPSRAHPSSVDEVNDTARDKWVDRWANPELFSLAKLGVQAAGERKLLHPIYDGILTEAQAETAFILFKQRFCAISPHPSVLQHHSSLPSHPFLLGAAVYFAAKSEHALVLLSEAQLQNLESLLYQNLSSYHSGCRPTPEGILSALILSYLPPVPASSPGSDAFRMAGLAYTQVRELGQSVYIDRLLRLVRTGISLDHIDNQVVEAQLFMSVINRSAWFAHSCAPLATLPVLVENTHSELVHELRQAGSVDPMLRHIEFEHRCLDILGHDAQEWQALQKTLMPQASNIDACNALLVTCHRELDLLALELESAREFWLVKTNVDGLPSSAFLQCHIAYCKWWTATRNAWTILRFPTPALVPECFASFMLGLKHLSEISSEMLVKCLRRRWKLGCLPAAIGNAVLLSFHTVRRATSHYERIGLPIPDYLSVNLQEVEALLRSSGPELETALTQCKQNLSDIQERPSPHLRPDDVTYSFALPNDLGRLENVWDWFEEQDEIVANAYY